MIDGERKITFFKQLPTSTEGKTIEVRTKVVGVYDKGKSSVVETETTVVDKDTEEVYSKALGSAFYVGQGGWGGPKGKFLSYCISRSVHDILKHRHSGPSTVNYPPPQGKKPDAVSVDQTSSETALLYR